MTLYTSFTPGYDAPRTDGILQVPANTFMAAKLAKICPHEVFNAEITVWCDGNIYLSEQNLRDIEKQLESSDIVVMTHPHRNCIYDEAAFCVEHGVGDAEKIKKQIEAYRLSGFNSFGLYACGVVARRHSHTTNHCSDLWFSHIEKWSSRDQISFPYVFQGIKIGTIPFESVEIRPHLKQI